MAPRDVRDYDGDEITPTVGSCSFTPYDNLTQAQRAAWRRELEEREARRIRPGFYVGVEPAKKRKP